MERGIIYCMSTVVNGLVKIGKTGSDTFEKRMYHLEHNGYCNVVGLKREFAIEVDDYEDKEILIHNIFGNNKVGNSELFAIDLELAIQLLSSFDGNQIYPLNKSKTEVFEQATIIRDLEKIPNGKYYFVNTPKLQGSAKKKYEATLEKSNNSLTLLAGSGVVNRNNITVDKWAKAKKNAKVENDILLKSIKCDSPSMAAAIVSGTHLDGWKCWKTKDGKKIDVFRKK